MSKLNGPVSTGAVMWPVAGLLCNALAWGLSWWPLRQLQALGLHPLWATAIFFMLGAALISVWRPSAWGQFFQHPAMWGLALAAGITNAAFNWAVSIGDVVRVVLLFYLMPVWAQLLAWPMLGERLSWSGWLRMGLALLGAFIVLQPAPPAGQDWAWPSVQLQLQGLPDILGVLGGIGFAVNNVLLRQQAHVPGEARALAMFVGGALVPMGIGFFLVTQGQLPLWPDWHWRWFTWAVLQGLFLFAANLALQYGAARVPVHVASVVMLSEILFAAVSAAWILKAPISMALWLGGSLIFVAALLSIWEPASDDLTQKG